MPIYEYRCDICAHELETIQKIGEQPLKTCPECKEDALIKRVSAAGFRLKGGGWYETDFKSGKKRNVSEKKTDSDNSSGSSSGDTKKVSSEKKKESTAKKEKASNESK
tara:strand:+ start:66 stop:389 length:324 start_codon:yes stop_codon:yes gene_type:complete